VLSVGSARDAAARAARASGALILFCTALAGCVGQGPELSPALDLGRFLRPERYEPRELGETLRETAPLGARASAGDVAPFVEVRRAEDSSTVHVLWPLFSRHSSLDERSFALRPLVAAESRPGRKDVEILWPLASYRREGEDRTFYLRPLFMYKRRVRAGPEGREVDTDWMLFPVLFGGRDTHEGAYFGIFPLGGVAKGALGKKRISFFLWPLWMATVDARYRSVSFMWPFISYWKGEDTQGRRLWPFFGVNRREGRFDRRFYLWPLWSRWRMGLDTKYPGEATFFLPFYGRMTSRAVTESGGEPVPFRDTVTVLWPLFSYQRLAVRNMESLHVPWPFIGLERADGLVVRKLWPIWGERKSNDRRDRFALWPLYRRSVWHDQDEEHRWHNVAVLFSSELARWVESKDGTRLPPAWPEGFGFIPDPRIEAGRHRPWETAPPGSEVRSRRWVQLWPLFHYSRDETGERRFQMLSLLPRRAGGRAEALWSPFYTLYRCERSDRERRDSAFLGLVRHFRRSDRSDGPGMRYVNVAGIVSYHRRSGIGKKFALLGGLVGYERVGDRRAWRFLWIPFGRIPDEVRERYELAR